MVGLANLSQQPAITAKAIPIAPLALARHAPRSRPLPAPHPSPGVALASESLALRRVLDLASVLYWWTPVHGPPSARPTRPHRNVFACAAPGATRRPRAPRLRSLRLRPS